MSSLASNAALAAFDISGYQGVRGKNFYAEDHLLQRIIEKYAASYTPDHRKDMEKHLYEYGALAGSILDELVSEAHKTEKLPQIRRYSRTGERIDLAEYCYEQREVRRINYQHGLVNLDFHPEWRHPFTDLHRMALAYMANMNGEGGICCPLAMTDGMIRVLRALGNPEQKEKYLKLLADPQSESHFMAGQYLTERVGGSNVSANRTIARQGENGKWRLHGEKWFCSNPGDLWVTTARIEGSKTIGMFLVSRTKEDASLNTCYYLRKKDIIGTKGKLTIEVVYDDVEAEALGRPGHGLANMLQYVLQCSRLHVACSATGISRRAFMEARAYTQVREAYGKKIALFPSVQKTLVDMQVLHSALLWCFFKNLELSGKQDKLSSLLTPLLKYIASTHAVWISHEAMLLHGGNGILDDFSCLPRLHNDAIINETWEGTHQVLTEHAFKAFLRAKINKAYFDLVEQNMQKAAGKASLAFAVHCLDKSRAFLVDMQQGVWMRRARLRLCDNIYYCLALSECLAEAAQEKEEGVFHALCLGLAEIMEEKQGASPAINDSGLFSQTALLEDLIRY